MYGTDEVLQGVSLLVHSPRGLWVDSGWWGRGYPEFFRWASEMYGLRGNITKTARKTRPSMLLPVGAPEVPPSPPLHICHLATSLRSGPKSSPVSRPVRRHPPLDVIGPPSYNCPPVSAKSRPPSKFHVLPARPCTLVRGPRGPLLRTQIPC